MQNRDTILTINVVEPAMVQAVRKHAAEKNIDLKGVVLVGKDYADKPNRPRDNSGLFKEIICDFDDPAEIQSKLKPYTDRLLAATCRYEDSMHQFRKVLPFVPYALAPTETSLVWAQEKTMMRDRLSNYDASLTPRYRYLKAKDLARLKELVADFKFPVIVKPSGLAASLLVSECKDRLELEDCLINTFEIIHDVYKNEHRDSAPVVLIEEMMQGDMYSTDAYVTADGEIFCLPLVKVITAHSIGLPGFYSYRHVIPVGLSEEETEKAFEASRSAIKALNLRSTSTHIELFQTPDGWKIIELGARIGGYRQALYQEAFGVDHFYNDLAIHMGEKPQMPGEPIKHAAGVNIYADKEGIIKSIKGLEEAAKLESVVFVAPHARPGDIALFADKGGNLLVDGILSNEDPEKLEADVAKLRELIEIEVGERAPVSMALASE